MELQLQILGHCLMARGPVLDFGLRNCRVGYVSANAKDHKKDPRSHDELALKIIFTCRTYREVGWEMFWQQNQFQYSQSMASLMSLQYERLILPSSSKMLRHLIIRQSISNDHGSIIREMLESLELCTRFKSLETLTVHIVLDKQIGAKTRGRFHGSKFLVEQLSEACRFYESCPQICSRTTNPSSASLRDLGQRPNDAEQPKPVLQDHAPAFNGSVKQIIVSGLPEDEFKLDPLYVRLLATVLHPSGQVGIGQGRKGSLYYFNSNSQYAEYICKSHKSPTVTWVKAEEIQEWIQENGNRRLPASSVLGYLRSEWTRVPAYERVTVNWDHPLFRGWA